MELSTADAVLDREVLDRLHVERDAFDLSQLRLQAANDFRGGFLTLVAGFEIDLDAAAVGSGVDAVDADKRRQAVDRWIFENDLSECLLALRHGSERNRLRGVRDAQDYPSVLYRKKAFGHHDKEQDGEDEGRDGNDQGGGLMLENPLQS